MCLQWSRNKAWWILRIYYSRQAERIFITNSLRKSSPGTRPSGSKMLLHQHLKKRERSMLLFKLDTSHARMGLLLPRSGSRVNKSELPDESSNDSEPLCELHFQQLALFFSLFFHNGFIIFFIFFRASFFIFFSEKKTGFILAREFPLVLYDFQTSKWTFN